MSLATSTIPITFSGGLDQKTPKELVVPGKFLALENCVRRKISLIEKRYGYSALSKGIFGTSSEVATGLHLDVTNDDVVLFADGKCFSYSSANDKWIDKGSALTAFVDSNPAVRNTSTQAMPDIAHLRGITTMVWEDSRGGVRYSVYDDDTGAALVNDVEISATASRPKVIALEDNFLIVYYLATELKSRTIAVLTPTTLGAAQTLAGSVSDAPYDIDTYTSYGVFAYNNASSLITVGYITPAGLPGSAGTNSLPSPVSTTGTGTAASCLTITPDPVHGKIWVSYHGSAGVVRTHAWTSDLVTSSAVDVVTVADVKNITAAVTATGTLAAFYERDPGTGVHFRHVRSYVATWTVTSSATASAPATVQQHVGLISKAITIGTAQYLIVTHESTLQPSYFLMRGSDGFLVARIHSNVGGGLARDASGTVKPGLCRIMLDSDSKYIVALQIRVKVQIETGGTTLTANKGLNKVALTFDDINLKGATLGKNYHLAGGTLLNYDGVRVTEHGFHVFPEDITKTSPVGGSMTAGDHSFRVVYEYTDAKGLIHRSAPSITITETVLANDQVALVVPTLQLTDKDFAAVKIVVYQAAVGLAVVYYRSGEIANSTADTVTISITADADPTKEILYTTGGVMDNIAPPAAKVVHNHKNRLFIAGTRDDEIYFSKRFQKDEGVGFVDLITVKCDATGGPVTALATLDDKLVIFKKARIYFLTGDGPLPTAQQNDYGDPQLVAGDVGTVDPQSIAVIPQGILFKSGKGIYLLSRALGLKYIGAGVEDYNAFNITSATVLVDENEVRFTTSEGVCLVYNYYFDQWSTFTNYAAIAAVNGLGTYLHLKVDATVNKEVVGSFADNGTRFAMGIESSWFSFAGIQGYQRIYCIDLLGQFVSHHHTRVKIAYDYENVYNETKYFNTETAQGATTTYGDDALYGDGVYGGASPSEVYQLEIRPRRQKCQAMKIRIEDVDTIEATPSGSFKLVTMTAEVGRKRGTNKMKAARRGGD